MRSEGRIPGGSEIRHVVAIWQRRARIGQDIANALRTQPETKGGHGGGLSSWQQPGTQPVECLDVFRQFGEGL